MYKLITTSNCSKCKTIKNKLNNNNILYKEVDAYSIEGLELCKKYKIMSAGIIVDDNGIVDINNILKENN